MPIYGSLDQDRHTFTGVSGAEIVVKDLATSERSRFMMWYSRFKIQWRIFKEQFPEASLQTAYDEDTLDDEGALVANPYHCPPIKWVVDHLMALAGVPITETGLDIIYALLVDWKEQGFSVFDQMWLNHPKIDVPDSDSRTLPEMVDQAENLMAELLRAGYKSEDIQYCLDVMPERELQIVLKLVAARHAEDEAKAAEDKPDTPKRNRKGKKSGTDDPYMQDLMKTWYSPEIQQEMEHLKSVNLSKEKFEREWAQD